MDPSYKICKACRSELPVTEFYDKTATCKACRKVKDHLRYERLKDGASTTMTEATFMTQTIKAEFVGILGSEMRKVHERFDTMEASNREKDEEIRKLKQELDNLKVIRRELDELKEKVAPLLEYSRILEDKIHSGEIGDDIPIIDFSRHRGYLVHSEAQPPGSILAPFPLVLRPKK